MNGKRKKNKREKEKRITVEGRKINRESKSIKERGK